MAQSYQRALKALSSAGGSRLKASQLSWLGYVSRLCFSKPAAKTAHPVAGSACLQGQMQSRVEQLDQAGLRLGTLVLNRIDEFEALPNPPDDDTDGNNGMVVHHAGYPQFDGALSTAQMAWNAQQAQRSLSRLTPQQKAGDLDSTDLVQDYVIGCANADLLSMSMRFSEYNHGAAHGLSTRGVQTHWLLPLRLMVATDLFSTDSDWQAKLPALFVQAYLANNAGGLRSRNASAEKVIREAASEVSGWLITPAGLQIDFSDYEAGSYAGTPGPVTVPWAALKPLLGTRGAPACDFASVDKH